MVARAAHTGAVPARGHGNADGSHAAGTASVEYFGAAERAFLIHNTFNIKSSN